MKKTTFLFLVLIFTGTMGMGQDWPREINIKNTRVMIYQPQTDSMKGDHLYSRMAFSVSNSKLKNPIFGALWTDSRFSTDRASGTCTIFDIKVLNMRFPGIDTIDPGKVKEYKTMLEKEATSWNIDFTLDEMKSSLDQAKSVTAASANFRNDPPEIIFVKKKSLLVLFDGDPSWKDAGKDVKRAINTPYLLLQDQKDKKYYLYGGTFWYQTPDLTKAWTNIAKPSAPVQQYFEALKKEMEKQGKSAQQKQDSKSTAPVNIIVRTKPAELIQSDGEPKYEPIQGTQLLYMTNTEDNIFMTIDKNAYYVLLSGRWYSASTLNGPWKYIESDQLPADFAKIPEGSKKDIVLASVAGTDAAKDAVLDAQIPQTAAVDRKTAKCTVKWDGDPKFEKIKGTELAKGMNTSSTVILCKNVYYVCDNAVWFTGKAPSGPWEVATSVPDEIQKIPPDDPAYNVKYVYIYDVEPEVVYVGYTPGYTGCYVAGPTVVYGTGYPYPPFYGPYYYPHPVTFGFSMHYNPWYGFSMGFSMSYGMFSFSFGGPMGYPGGCWGPPMYRPPYGAPYSHYYGAHPPAYRGGGNTINIDNSRNMYNDRPDRSTKPSTQPSRGNRGEGNKGQAGTRPAQQPAGGRTDGGRADAGRGDAGRTSQPKASTQPAAGTRDANRAQNNVYTDKNGDVYRNNNGEWQKNNGRDWEAAQHSDRGTQAKTQDRGGFNQQEMNRQSQARDRGTQNSYNRSSAQQSYGGNRSYSGGGGRSSGGGARSGGGGRRR